MTTARSHGPRLLLFVQAVVGTRWLARFGLREGLCPAETVSWAAPGALV